MTGALHNIRVLAALAHRTETGEGQYVDLALLDTQVASMGMNYLVSGVIPQRQGNAHASIVPYQVFFREVGQSSPQIDISQGCRQVRWSQGTPP